MVRLGETISLMFSRTTIVCLSVNSWEIVTQQQFFHVKIQHEVLVIDFDFVIVPPVELPDPLECDFSFDSDTNLEQSLLGHLKVAQRAFFQRAYLVDAGLR